MGYKICPHFKEMLQKFHERCGHFKLYLPLCPFSSNSLPLEVFYFFFNIYFLAMLHGMWDLSSLLGIKPMPLVLEVWSLNHWTTREVL